MNYWHAPKLWLGKTVYIIGGGPSINGMNLSLIHSERVIGCNDAYALGDWVDVCYFGDHKWYLIHNKQWIERPGGRHRGLRRFPGLKVTCSNKPINDPSVRMLQRVSAGHGIFEAPQIGWNHNTGASAINLAIIFGARKIVLLGFDMKLNGKGLANWHYNLKDKPDAKVYKNKFMPAFKKMKEDLDQKHPDVEVLNATPDSQLDLFPMVDFEKVA